MPVDLISPQRLKELLAQDQAVLVDVREPSEYKEENIPKALNIPLASVNVQGLDAFAGKTLVFQCQSGRRSREACSQFETLPGNVASLDGGIEAWKKAGFTVGGHKPYVTLPLMRQVQLVIGVFVLAGTILSYFVSPAFLLIPLIMGAGLTNAGLTGWCGLARLLAVMPWNR